MGRLVLAWFTNKKKLIVNSFSCVTRSCLDYYMNGNNFPWRAGPRRLASHVIESSMFALETLLPSLWRSVVLGSILYLVLVWLRSLVCISNSSAHMIYLVGVVSPRKLIIASCLWSGSLKLSCMFRRKYMSVIRAYYILISLWKFKIFCQYFSDTCESTVFELWPN